MVTFHAFQALFAGFATIILLVLILAGLLRLFAPQWAGQEARPDPAYVAVNLGFSFIAAASGGYVAVWVAQADPLAVILTLAVAVLVLGAISALQMRGKQPLWYQAALLVLGPVGVAAGGLLRLRVLGLI